MRYPNHLLNPDVEALRFPTPSNPNGLTPAEAAQTGIFYPSWISVSRHNLVSGDSIRASGFADRVLIREPRNVNNESSDQAGQTNVGFAELKPFWAYPNEGVLVELLNGSGHVLRATGQVRTDGNAASIHTSRKLLVQVRIRFFLCPCS